jgi:transposase
MRLLLPSGSLYIKMRDLLGGRSIDMALLSVIRRWHFRQHIPIREIERRTGLSRNTIRKYLRADAVEPKFKVPDRPSKLDPFVDKLSGWLRIDAGKSRKQKRTAKQMHADLVALGYDGSYNRVAAFVRAWKADRQRDAQTRCHSRQRTIMKERVSTSEL